MWSQCTNKTSTLSRTPKEYKLQIEMMKSDSWWNLDTVILVGTLFLGLLQIHLSLWSRVFELLNSQLRTPNFLGSKLPPKKVDSWGEGYIYNIYIYVIHTIHTHIHTLCTGVKVPFIGAAPCHIFMDHSCEVFACVWHLMSGKRPDVGQVGVWELVWGCARLREMRGSGKW